MGLLSLGTPLSWEEAVKFADHVRSEGIKQFLNAYNKGQGYNPNYWTWGDEVKELKFPEGLKTLYFRLSTYW